MILTAGTATMAVEQIEKNPTDTSPPPAQTTTQEPTVTVDQTQKIPADSQNATDYFRRAYSEMQNSNYDQAIADLNQALQINPQYAQAYFRRAYVYMLTSKYDQALADLNQAIQINPQYGQAYYRRAFVYMIKGNYDQAIADLNQELQIDPQNTQAYGRLVAVYIISGNYDQAIACLNQTIQTDPKSVQAYIKRGNVYMFKGDYTHAITDLNQAIQIDPQNPNAYNLLAWLSATCPQANFRDGKKAVEYATKACELSGWNAPPIIDTLAAAYAEAGDFTDAVKWEDKFVETPDLDAGRVSDGKSRLVLYQANQPYHVDKFNPHLDLLINLVSVPD